MIQSLRLQRFRSYEDDSFEFEPGVNIIVGPNASGKTNLLESILLASLGGSYRGRNAELVKHGRDWSRIDVQIASEGQRTVKFQDQAGKLKRSIEILDQQYMRMPAAKKLPVVLFEPNSLLLFHGGPELRRELIDTLLDQLKPEFAVARRQYKRVLLQRNSLIKSGRTSSDEFFVWNIRLSDLGGVIAKERLWLASEMNKQLPIIYEKISGANTPIEIVYKSKCRSEYYASDLLRQLENNLAEEILRGHTLYGPHRDDIEVLLNDHPVKEAASRGEVRTIVLALKVFEQVMLEQYMGKKPLLLLDDVFSELDGARRRHLTDFLKDHQVFITTTDADVVVQHFADEHKIIALTRPET